MDDDEVVIRIREFHPLQLCITENGITRTKNIPTDTLVNCIRQSLKHEQISTGLLPQNTLSVKLGHDGSRYVVLEFPDAVADIQYLNTVYPHFPIPRYLFRFTVESSGRVSGVKLGVPDLGKLTPDTPMYQYPFSNIHEFRMCTGANVLPHIQDLRELQNLPYFILSLPDNDDHYHAGHNRLGLGHRELLEHLRDKDRQYYYDHLLLPMPGKTLNDFL